MDELLDVGVSAINRHCANIYNEEELDKVATIFKMEIVQIEGGGKVTRQADYYKLEAIISVGYRVNSIRATQFRLWCIYVLRLFVICSYVIDKKRMGKGSFIGEGEGVSK